LDWHESGIFRRLGIDADSLAIEVTGPRAAAGLVSGDWDFAEVGSSPTVRSVLDRHDAVILATPTKPASEAYLTVKRGITSQGSSTVGVSA
jgi:hypothetical protein